MTRPNEGAAAGAAASLRAAGGRLRSLVRAARWRGRFLMASLWRKAMAPEHVVAVTGSGGKSTTVGLAALVLSTKAETFVNMGFNTAPALAKASLAARRRHRMWVNEVSGHKPGAIEESVSFLKHDIAVVTTVGSDHYRNFRSEEAIAAEKGKLVELLPPQGLAVLNADDALVAAMAGRTSARVLTFGRSANADIRLIAAASAFPLRLSLQVAHGDATVEIRTQLVGERWITPVLAAIAIGQSVGIDLAQCKRAVEAWRPYEWRDEVHELADGACFIADTMKAPLWTIPSSIATVSAASAVRKTMVFGTISDYAGTPRTKYMNVAREALSSAERVIFVGDNAERVARLKPEFGDRLQIFVTVREAHEYLRRSALPGELIYLKGSASDHLERLVLDRLEPIDCWVQGCGVLVPCTSCRRLYADGRRGREGFDPKEMLASSGIAVSRA